MNPAPQRKFSELAQLRAPMLCTAEKFVIGACRCWDAFMDSPDSALGRRELTPVFAFMNVLGALCAFEHAFTILKVHRRRPLQFHDGESVQVGIDEARMLCALACLQRAEVRPVRRLFTEPLSPLGVRTLLPPLARIAAVLDAQGHRLPPWQSNAQPYDLPQPRARDAAAIERALPTLRFA